MTTKYGFAEASIDGKPAWFHTRAAAMRFAHACGWGHADIETTDNADPDDILDTLEKPWHREPIRIRTVASIVPVRDTLEAEPDKTPAAELLLASRSWSNESEGREMFGCLSVGGVVECYFPTKSAFDRCGAIFQRAHELLAENAKLRAALKSIADGTEEYPWLQRSQIASIARAALAGKEGAL